MGRLVPLELKALTGGGKKKTNGNASIFVFYECINAACHWFSVYFL